MKCRKSNKIELQGMLWLSSRKKKREKEERKRKEEGGGEMAY